MSISKNLDRAIGDLARNHNWVLDKYDELPRRPCEAIREETDTEPSDSEREKGLPCRAGTPRVRADLSPPSA